MHLKRMFIPAKEIETGESSHPRERDIALPEFKDLGEVHRRLVQAHPLTLMYRDRPSKTKRQLRNSAARLSAFFHRPVHRLNFNTSSVSRLYHRIAARFIKSLNRTERAVHKSFLRIIFRKHHRRSGLKIKCRRRKTTLFWRGNNHLGAMRGHSKRARLARKF